MRKNMPQMQNGTKSFGGREILHGMNLSVERGIIYGLLGVNGDGKSTAFKFVLKSISEGYSRKRIRMNLNCIIRSAGRTRNLVALITAGELLAMLDDMNEFESTGEEYFQAICDIKGASKLNQLMQNDGKPTFDRNIGRLACYISSKAGITPGGNCI